MAILIAACAVLLDAAWSGAAHAQSSGGSYTLDRIARDAGGGRATGGVFALESSIGQHDASGPQSGGAFTLAGGFQTTPNDNPLLQDGFE